MPFCPECKYEYVEGVTECPDCQVPLVESLGEGTEGSSPFGDSTTPWVAKALSAPGATSSEDLVACWQAKDLVEAEAASAALRDQGIPCLIRKSERPSYSAYTRDESYPASYFVLVPGSKELEARQILGDVMPNLELTPGDETQMPEAPEVDDETEDEADEDRWSDQ
ncbi:MAG TPA: hypothetical protein VMX94_11415 [Armatimonadota bacterium]|nr:hypothetical protein [Armatimonadota bacterium]